MRLIWPGLLVLLIAIPVAAARAPEATLQHAQELLDSGRLDDALAQLDGLLKKDPRNAGGLFLRSTAHIMNGDLSAGRRDLEACLQADPANRQAWLNLAALELADEDYSGAVTAFERAEALDPQAPDNALNIGAALLLGGDRERASRRFKDYLSRHPEDPNAFYLVAANYAMASRPQLSVPLLAKAIQLDERIRLRARTDANFAALSADPTFQELLGTDSFRPVAGTFTASRTYDLPYAGRDSRVLDATLTALQRSGHPLGSGVEITPRWALVWSDMRIKIAAAEASRTTLTLYGEPTRFSESSWQDASDDLFRRIAFELSSRRPVRD